MNKYGLHGKLKAKKGMGAELASILLQASKLLAIAKGCQAYIVSKDPNDKDCVWVTEVWDDKEDHKNSLHSEKVRALISTAIPMLEELPQKGQELDVLGGLGVN